VPKQAWKNQWENFNHYNKQLAMKYFGTLITLLSVLLLASCGGGGSDVDTSTIEGKKQQIKKLKADIKNLNVEIEGLEKALAEQDPNYNAKKVKTLTITVDTAKVEQYTEFVEVQGSIETKGTYRVSPEMGGTIVSLKVDEGDYVRAGQLVASLDDTQIKSGIAEIETGLSLAKDVYERRKKLWDQKIGSELEYLQSKNNVEALEKKLETIQIQLNKMQVYSPSSGVVEMVNIKQGELAAPGMPIVTLMDLSRVQIVSDVSENYLKAVKVGEKIDVTIPALDLETTAKITKIGSIINPANRTFKIEADISNKGGKLKPNLLANIKIKEFEAEKAVLVPSILIKQDTKGDYVYVVKKDKDQQIAKRIDVEKSRSFEGKTIITKGLNGGELIVAEGRSALGNGDSVRIK